MASIQFHLLPLAVFFFLLLTIHAETQPPTSSTDYISEACKTTTYQKLCINSLTPFADNLKEECPSAVTTQALDLAISIAERTHKRVTTVSQEFNTSKVANANVLDAINVCGKAYAEIRGQLGKALTLIREISSAGPEEFGAYFSEAYMGVAAGLNYMDQCVEQWKAIEKSVEKNPLITDIIRPTEKVWRFATNAGDLLKNLRAAMESNGIR